MGCLMDDRYWRSQHYSIPFRARFWLSLARREEGQLREAAGLLGPYLRGRQQARLRLPAEARMQDQGRLGPRLETGRW